MSKEKGEPPCFAIETGWVWRGEPLSPLPFLMYRHSRRTRASIKCVRILLWKTQAAGSQTQVTQRAIPSLDLVRLGGRIFLPAAVSPVTPHSGSTPLFFPIPEFTWLLRENIF